jgi:ribose transport system permease protein
MKNSKLLSALRGCPPVVYMLIAFVVVFSAISPNYFSASNIANIFVQCAPLMVMAFAQTIIILTEGIDMSLNAIVNVTTVLSVFLATKGMPLVVSMIVAVCVATVIGAANGILVAKLHLPAFIVTYGMQNIVNSIALLITGGASIYFESKIYQNISDTSVLMIPTIVWIVILVFILSAIVLNRTKLGMNIRALGGNVEALRLAGVNPAISMIKVYMFAGFLTGIAGIITLCRVESGQPIVANGWEFQSVAATILGGTAFLEGKGGLTGTIFGVLLIQIIQNGLNVIGVQAIYQSVLVGTFVLIAIIIDALARSRSKV